MMMLGAANVEYRIVPGALNWAECKSILEPLPNTTVGLEPLRGGERYSFEEYLKEGAEKYNGKIWV